MPSSRGTAQVRSDRDRASGLGRGATRLGFAVLAVLVLAACAPPPGTEFAGRYRHEGPIAATLEVRAEAGRYVVRLEGGSAATGAAIPADCTIVAAGDLDGATLRAPFGPVETDTFAYSPAQAERERRMVEIVFEPGAAEVLEADTVGYCGWGAAFAGRYRAAG